MSALLAGAAAAGIGAVAGLANTAIQQNLPLSKAAQQQNAFNAAEAQKARDWQENFYNKYSSIEAQVRQYEAAGINPAAVFGNVSPASTPSGSQASSGNQGAARVDALNGIIQAIGLQQMIKNNEVERNLKTAEADNVNAETERIRNENSVFGERWDFEKQLKSGQIDNLTADTLVKRSQQDLNRAGISEKEAHTALMRVQEILGKTDASFREQYWRSSLATATLQRERLTLENEHQRIDNKYQDRYWGNTLENQALSNEEKRKRNAQLDNILQLEIERTKTEIRNLAQQGIINEQEALYLEAKTVREAIGILGEVGKKDFIIGDVRRTLNPSQRTFSEQIQKRYTSHLMYDSYKFY